MLKNETYIQFKLTRFVLLQTSNIKTKRFNPPVLLYNAYACCVIIACMT